MAVNDTKESKAAYMREYRKKNKDVFKNIDLKRNYGITLVEYNEMLEIQEGLCAICGNPETSRDHRTKELRALAVDHNHDTGEVRGLLCGDCNTGIGLLQDDIELLLNAIDYLKMPKRTPSE